MIKKLRRIVSFVSTHKDLKRGLLFFSLGLWISGLAVGLNYLITFSTKAGEKAAIASSSWPIGSQIEFSKTKPLLLVFVHPLCSCSQATIGELEKILPKILPHVETKIVLSQPKTAPREWAKSNLWKRASRLPNVQIIIDQDNIETDLFGAKTSGQVYLFDENAQLVFEGGITPARGHMGDNKGTISIVDWVKNRRMPASATTVFGCALNKTSKKLTPSSPLSEQLNITIESTVRYE